MKKLDCFSYVSKRLDNFYREELGITESLSNIKKMRLFYFLCMGSSTLEDYENYLFDIFDNFRAFPQGPIEIDIYDSIEEIPESISEEDISLDLISSVDRGIGFLRTHFTIELLKTELIELFRLLPSWKNAYFLDSSTRDEKIYPNVWDIDDLLLGIQLINKQT